MVYTSSKSTSLKYLKCFFAIISLLDKIYENEAKMEVKHMRRGVT